MHSFFGWMGLAPEIRTGGSGGGDVYIFHRLLLRVKEESVVPATVSVSGWSALWWGDAGGCCFSQVSTARNSTCSHKAKPKMMGRGWFLYSVCSSCITSQCLFDYAEVEKA